MLDPITISTDTPGAANRPPRGPSPLGEGVGGEVNTPLKERAWALYCQGHRSPAISEQIGVSERTVRHWINHITADLNTHHTEQRQHHLLLAIERKRYLATAVWDGYERAIQLAEGERAHAVEARDEEISTACVRAARHALNTAVRYLTLAAANDRDLTTLTSLHDEHCHEREAEARDQERQAREAERAQDRERERQARAHEHFEREQARLDRQKEREREPQPPPWLNPARVESQRCCDPRERRPEINAYFAARDAYHTARQAADDYTRVLESVAAREEFYGLTSTYRAPTDQPTTDCPPAVLATLTLGDIAALQARLDAEEAQTAEAVAQAPALTTASPLSREAGEGPGEGAKIEPAAKTATSGSPSPRRGGGWGERSVTQPTDWTIPASFRATEDENDITEDDEEDGDNETENAAKTAIAAIAPQHEATSEASLCS